MSQNYNDLRQQLLGLRQQQDPSETRRGALLMRGRLFSWLNVYKTKRREQGLTQPLNVAAFWSLGDEPELAPLLSQWSDDPLVQLSLPVMEKEGQPLLFKPWDSNTELKTAQFGVKEPATEQIAPDPDIILVPTLGFTRQGDRIGYGKGYYDRTLAHLKAKQHAFISIGIAWATGDLSTFNYQPAAHDVSLDAVLTDKGWAVPAPAYTL